MSPSPKTVERVCALVRQGWSLRAVAARVDMPRLDTLTRWLDEDGAFRARYERACDIQREIFADDVVAIADAAAGDKPAGVKLRIDARKWRVAVIKKDMAKNIAETFDDDGELIARLERAHARIAEANALAGPAAESIFTAADADGDAGRHDEPLP